MKARSFTVLLTALLVVLCTGCGIHINTSKELTFDDTIHYSTYENAADYAAGSSIYQAEEVHAVRVYWIAGEISVTEKDTDTLSVSDAAGDRSQEAQLHSLLRDGVLTIHYCASDFRGELKPEWKLLTLEIPHGIELTIESVSAPIYATALTTPQLHITTVSGDVSIGSITGDNLRIDTVSGEFDVDTAEVKTVTMNSVSGDFDLERITVDQLTGGYRQRQCGSGAGLLSRSQNRDRQRQDRYHPPCGGRYRPLRDCQRRPYHHPYQPAAGGLLRLRLLCLQDRSFLRQRRFGNRINPNKSTRPPGGSPREVFSPLLISPSRPAASLHRTPARSGSQGERSPRYL